jgi:hypothetical protein
LNRLKIPLAWADEYCQTAMPRVFQDTEFERLGVALSYSSAQRWLGDFTLADIADDLARGMTVRQQMRDDRVSYLLTGARYAVIARQRHGRATGYPLAYVTSVKPNENSGLRDRVRPAKVGFHLLEEEEPLVLEFLEHAYTTAVKTFDRRRLALGRAQRKLRDRRALATFEAGPQERIQNQYRPLQLMLRLLERRSTLEGKIEATGEALGSGPGDDGDVLWIRSPDAVRFSEGRTATLLVSGQQPQGLRIHTIEDDRLAVSAPADDLAPGTSVRLEQPGRFALAQHQMALNRLLDRDVAGDWLRMAQFLSMPEELPVPTIRAPTHFFDPQLNSEQRAAVAGALSAPHAFCIQGPPGTGKTTVIVELVQQLLARGERVLLVAPMHVAVDEVLGRLVDKPGVLAIRFSWDEGRVHEKLRGYLPEQVSRTYLRQARRPEMSKESKWRREIAELSREHSILDGYLAAQGAQRMATTGLTQAERNFHVWADDMAQKTNRADVDLAAAELNLQELDARIWSAAAELDRIAAELGSKSLTGRLWGRLTDIVGAPNEVSRLTAAHQQADDEHRRLRYERSNWGGYRQRIQDHKNVLRRQSQDGEIEHGATLTQARDVVTVAKQELRASTEALRRATGHEPQSVDLTELTDRHARLSAQIELLENRIALERRWFELSQPSGGPHAAQEEVDASLRRSANLVCCTTAGIPRDLDDFDTLIVDEASRVVDSEFLIGAVRARRWILVGDEKQLPPYVAAEDEYHLHALSALNSAERDGDRDVGDVIVRLGDLWREEDQIHQVRVETVQQTAERLVGNGTWSTDYRQMFQLVRTDLSRLGTDPDRPLLESMSRQLVHSLFERTIPAIPAELRHALRWQRRMIEPIAELVREPVYGGDLRTPQPTEVRPLLYGPTKTPVVFADTSAFGARAREQQVGHGFVNSVEVELVAKMCRSWERRLRQSGGEKVTTSVLTFYRAQATAIRAALGGPRYPDFRLLEFQVVDAIDKIQGQQSDLVFISFVRARDSRLGPRFGWWLQDLRRLTVACTRARRALVLVGHAPTLRRLNGVPAAEAFYANLFDLLGRRSDFETVRDPK